LLERLLSDPEPQVRVAALEAAAAVGGDAAAGLVAELLARDTDAGVRAAALGWAAEHPLVPLEDLGQAAVFALADRNVESSLNAVRALAARAEAEPLDRGTCVQLLEQLAGVREYPVRVAAASALEALGRPRPPVGAVDSGLDLDAYRQVVQRTRRPRTVAIATSAGALTVRLDCPRAPLTCLNFLNLAGQGFYEGLTFHRVVPDFVVQGGDPRGDGWGGPGYAVRDEIGTLRYRRGVVGMALAGADTGGSQFFVTLSPQPHLDGGYTAFGEVVAGGEVLERIVPGTRIESVREVAGR
jgi:cyclophilin family peptidyl-prolyl cis-trans isomerase